MTTMLHYLGMGSGLGSLAPRWGLCSQPLLCTSKARQSIVRLQFVVVRIFLSKSSKVIPIQFLQHTAHTTHKHTLGKLSCRVFLLEGGTNNYHSTAQAEAGFCKKERGGKQLRTARLSPPSRSAQEQNSEGAHFEQGVDRFASNGY